MSTLLRLHLRARRGFLLAWLIPLVALMAVTPAAYAATYPDEGELEILAVPMRLNLGLRAMYGVVPEPFTFGAFAQWETAMWLLILGSVMAVLLAVGLTRANEDSGNLEVLRSSGLPTARPTVAAAIVVFLACAVLGAGAAAGLVVSGFFIDGMPALGGVMTGAAIAAGTAACGAVGLLAAQISGTARAARTIGLAFVGAAFAVRAIADVREIAWLRWLSPLGWRDVVEPYSGDRVWPLAVMLVVIAATTVAAVRISGIRDLGSAWPERSRGGRARQPRDYRALGPMALRVRLERSALVSWFVALVLLTVFFMSMTGEMGKLLESTPGTADLVALMTDGGSMESMFVNLLATLIGILLGAAAIQIALAAHRDEKDGLLNLELPAGTPRTRPFLIAWAVALGLVAVITVAAAPLAALTAGAVSDADGIAGDAAWAIAGQAPAAIGMIGIAVFLAAALPKLAWLAWIPLAVSGFLTYFGGLFKLPEWMLDLSMLAHPPLGPDGTFSWGGTIVLLAIGIAGVALGAMTVGRRDLVA